jgi:hypothetical protein
MTDVVVDGRILTPKGVRAVWCNLVKPFKSRDAKPDEEPKYQVEVLLDREDLDALVIKAKEVAKASFPGQDIKTMLLSRFKSTDSIIAEKRAAGKDFSRYKPGQWALKLWSKNPPSLAYSKDGKATNVTDANRALVSDVFYHGCWVALGINFAAYNKNGNKGVTAYVDMAAKVKDDQRFGGRDAAEAFKGYIGTITQEDPTGGQALDDEIPF